MALKIDMTTTICLVIFGIFLDMSFANVSNKKEEVLSQHTGNETPATIQNNSNKLMQKLKLLGKLSGHTHIDKILTTSENDISMNAGQDDVRFKRATKESDGVLTSKNIKANSIKSTNIKSEKVLADKILGDRIIADSIRVAKDIRRGNPSTGTEPSVVFNPIPDQERDLNEPVPTLAPNVPGSTLPTEPNESGLHQPIQANRLGLQNRIDPNGLGLQQFIHPISQGTRQKPVRLNIQPSLKTQSTPELRPFLHTGQSGTSGQEFVRGPPGEKVVERGKTTETTSKGRRNGLNLSISTGKLNDNIFDQFISKRDNGLKLKSLFPEGFPKLSEAEESGITKRKISDNSGTLRAKEIQSGSISAQNTRAKKIRADVIKSKTIDAKLIVMRERTNKPKEDNNLAKPQTALYESTHPIFTVNKTPEIKSVWELPVQNNSKSRILTVNHPDGIMNGDLVPKTVTSYPDLPDHDPFATGHTFIRENQLGF